MAAKGNCYTAGDAYTGEAISTSAAHSRYFGEKFKRYPDARQRYESYLADAAIQKGAILALQKDIIAARNRYDEKWRAVIAQFDSGAIAKHEAEGRLKEIRSRLEQVKQIVAETRKQVSVQKEQVRQAMQAERDLSLSLLSGRLIKNGGQQWTVFSGSMVMDKRQTGQIEKQWDSRVTEQNQALSDLYDSDKGKEVPTLTNQQKERSNEDFEPSRIQDLSNHQAAQPGDTAHQRQGNKNLGSSATEDHQNTSPPPKARKGQKNIANDQQLLEENKRVTDRGIMETEKALGSSWAENEQLLLNLYDADKDKEARRQQEASARALEF